jgi:O-antigen ligase
MPHQASSRSPLLLQIANQIILAELIWPLPLLLIGIAGLVEPLLIGVTLSLALIPWLARWFLLGRPTRNTFIGKALGLFMLSAIVSMGATYDPALSWPMLLTLAGSISLFFAIANTFIPPRRVAGGLVVVAGLGAFYFVGQYAHFDYQGEVGRLADLGRITGFLLPNMVFFVPHPNAMAGFLEGAFLLSLVLIRHSRNGEQIGWGLIALLMAYGLLISASRGSWLGLAVALGIWGLLLNPNRGFRLGLIGSGVVVLIIGVYTVGSQTHDLAFLNSIQQTIDSRLILYRNTFYLFKDYIFTGIGLGDVFALVYSRYQLLIPVPFLTYTHNLFLAVGLGLGLMGLVALIWLLFGFYLFVIQVERVGLNKRSLALFRGDWLGVTATLTHGLVDAPQFSAPGWTMPLLFALLGLAIASGRAGLAEQEEGNNIIKAHSRWRWSVVGTTAVVLMVVGGIFRQPLASAWYSNLGAVYQTRAELTPDLHDTTREVLAAQAITYFERALNFDPSQPAANRRFGMMALDKHIFDVAVDYLARAYEQEPHNQATLKALGLAYLWTGQLDSARELLQQRDDRSELVEELGTWGWWWGTQNRPDLSEYAAEMQKRLSE